jgi:hypothetical protein
MRLDISGQGWFHRLMSGTPPVPPKRPGLAQLQVIKAATDYSGKPMHMIALNNKLG